MKTKSISKTTWLFRTFPRDELVSNPVQVSQYLTHCTRKSVDKLVQYTINIPCQCLQPLTSCSRLIYPLNTVASALHLVLWMIPFHTFCLQWDFSRKSTAEVFDDVISSSSLDWNPTEIHHFPQKLIHHQVSPSSADSDNKDNSPFYRWHKISFV